MNLKEKFPHASQSFLKINSELPASQSKPAASVALGKTGKGETQIRGRIRVVYTGCFVRPQDADNLAGATKICTDTLRAVRLLPNDDPYSIELSWRQEKVQHFTDEKLIIEITK